jgi:Flp pilus assembly protein TadD
MNRTASSFLLLAAGAMLLAGCATIGGSRADKAAAAAPPPPLPSASKSIAAGDAMSRAGDLDGALAEYVRALTVDPKSVDAYFRIAQTHETLGDLDIAAGAYRKVLALNPEHRRAIEGLGLIFLRQKKLADARTTLTFAVQKNASLWAAHNGLGVIADLSGNSTLADGEYRKALALKPDSPEVLNNFGYSRYLVGQLKEAQAYFQRALAIDPASGKAWSNLGLIYARQGDYVRSVSAFRELMPEPQAYYSAG